MITATVLCGFCRKQVKEFEIYCTNGDHNLCKACYLDIVNNGTKEARIELLKALTNIYDRAKR